MNRRDFLKSLLAAGVSATAAPVIAQTIRDGEEIIAAGVDSVGNGWYRVWKTFAANHPSGVYINTGKGDNLTLHVPEGYSSNESPPDEHPLLSFEHIERERFNDIVNSDAYAFAPQLESPEYGVMMFSVMLKMEDGSIPTTDSIRITAELKESGDV